MKTKYYTPKPGYNVVTGWKHDSFQASNSIVETHYISYDKTIRRNTE